MKEAHPMAQNLNNNGVIAGRLAADPRILTNSDGSRKIFATTENT